MSKGNDRLDFIKIVIQFYCIAKMFHKKHQNIIHLTSPESSHSL